MKTISQIQQEVLATAHNRTGYCEAEITGREETHSYQR